MLVAGAGAADAAAIFSDGFESGDFSAWTTVQTGADGSATVQGTVVKTGANAARLSATAAAGSFAYARKSLTAAQSDLAATGDFQVQAEGATGGNVPIFRLFDASAKKVVSLFRQNGGAGGIWVWYDNTYNATSASLALNTWAQLQVHVVTTGAATEPPCTTPRPPPCPRAGSARCRSATTPRPRPSRSSPTTSSWPTVLPPRPR